jgi:hypothetical protein
MLFYLGHLSYYSDEIRWSRRFVDAVLLGTLVILLWWNQVVQEVYICRFTWDTRHITLMKSGGPGGLQMLFYLGRQSYYSDEIRWSRRFSDAVVLGTPVILLWWNQVVQEVCRCCFTWDTRHITLMKSGGSRRFTDAVLLGTPVILLWWNQVVQEVYRCCFTWDTRHTTLMKSGGPGGLQMLIYLGHPSYYSDEIRWSRRFTDAVLLETPVILLWWNQVV